MQSIEGDNLAGWYMDMDASAHGFICIIPEPASLLLLGLGGLSFRYRRK